MSDYSAWSRRLVVGVMGIVLVLSALTALALLTPVHEGPLSGHFDGRHFKNVPASATIDKSVFEVLRWTLGREPGPWTERRDIVYFSPPQEVSDNLRVTFVNHATVLIQTGGVNILTDPIWSERSSPLQWMGPKRFRDPGIRFKDLPPIDVVLISHNHYDHMDAGSIERLAQEHDPVFIVPLGNGRYLNGTGAARVTELDWWDSELFGVTEIHAVPAQHWSKRGAFDANRALWSGYVILSEAGPLYFAGDTGMGAHFAEISATFGPPRLAMLPIGAYLPEWFMKEQHIAPAEAVTAHTIMGAAESMAIHFGTFQLGDDGQDEPVRDLRQALRAAQISTGTFWVPANGESRVFEGDYESNASLTAR